LPRIGSMKPLLALLLAVLPLAACSDSEVAIEKQPITVFKFAELETVMAPYKGKPLLLNFWAIWCGPCVAELPELLEVGDEFADQGALVVGVSYDLMVPRKGKGPVDEELRGFLDAKGWDFPVLVYDEDDFDIEDHFGLPGGIPQTLAINAVGEVVDRQDGPAGRERFVEMMRAAMAE
jgi:thiol-disulfide isomerase/thioredoxin